jgi:hypothetical protein
MLALSALKDTRSVRKLSLLGIEWNRSMNLLPPSPQDAPWDREIAVHVARSVSAYMECDYSVIWLAGRRVTAAFDLSHAPFFSVNALDDCPTDGSVAYVPVPHPSGRNRWWNEEENVYFGQEAVREIQERFT